MIFSISESYKSSFATTSSRLQHWEVLNIICFVSTNRFNLFFYQMKKNLMYLVVTLKREKIFLLSTTLADFGMDRRILRHSPRGQANWSLAWFKRGEGRGAGLVWSVMEYTWHKLLILHGTLENKSHLVVNYIHNIYMVASRFKPPHQRILR
jgi:hypothetical protein